MTAITTIAATVSIALRAIAFAAVSIAWASSPSSSAVTVAATEPSLGCVLLERLIISPHFIEKLLTQLLRFLNALGFRSSNVEEHGLIALGTGLLFHEA